MSNYIKNNINIDNIKYSVGLSGKFAFKSYQILPKGVFGINDSSTLYYQFLKIEGKNLFHSDNIYETQTSIVFIIKNKSIFIYLYSIPPCDFNDHKMTESYIRGDLKRQLVKKIELMKIPSIGLQIKMILTSLLNKLKYVFKQ